MPDFRRKRPHHQSPDWVPDGEIYFITINCQERGANTLANAKAFKAIVSAANFYEEKHLWHVHLLLAMPDHLHGLIAFNNSQKSIKTICGGWKRYLSKTEGIAWQHNFFEHRIRDDAEYEEKASYIRMNPVRAGLCNGPGKWQFKLEQSLKD